MNAVAEQPVTRREACLHDRIRADQLDRAFDVDIEPIDRSIEARQEPRLEHEADRACPRGLGAESWVAPGDRIVSADILSEWVSKNVAVLSSRYTRPRALFLSCIGGQACARIVIEAFRKNGREQLLDVRRSHRSLQARAHANSPHCHKVKSELVAVRAELVGAVAMPGLPIAAFDCETFDHSMGQQRDAALAE